MRIYKNPAKARWAGLCRRPETSAENLRSVVAEVFRTVAADGDKALLDYTERFDKVSLGSVTVPLPELERSAGQVPSKLKEAIDRAYDNVTKFHKSQLPDTNKELVETAPGVTCWRELRPIERVGLYVPGGSAPLVSTALMLGVPAMLAGCREIILCTPPAPDGSVNPAISYASLKVGATKLVRVGGIQAIAALCEGTASVGKVDKIFGPGNQYVTAAKQYAAAAGKAAIDMPAGPSEVMVVADAGANPEFAAADLLSQAEHGPDSQALLVTDNLEQAESIRAALRLQLKVLPRSEIAAKALSNSFFAVFDSIDTALEFSNAYAPEHLILALRRPDRYVKAVLNAGSVFLGDYSPESAGDYASGTNHTLPTNGWARSYGGVSLDSFVKKVTFQSLTEPGLAGLVPTIVTLARAEGLEAHARAASIRIKGPS
jgi:histidinol dehydrogenase